MYVLCVGVCVCVCMYVCMAHSNYRHGNRDLHFTNFPIKCDEMQFSIPRTSLQRIPHSCHMERTKLKLHCFCEADVAYFGGFNSRLNQIN